MSDTGQPNAAWLAGAVAAGLGTLTAAAMTGTPLLTPAASIEWSDHYLIPTLASAAAVLAGLALIRWWPWLLLTGATSVLLGNDRIGVPLVLLALLAVAQDLLALERRTLAAAAPAGFVASAVLGSALIGAALVRPAPELHMSATVLACAGLFGAVAMVIRQPGAARPGSLRRPGVSAGDVLAAGLGLLPAVVHGPVVSDLLGLNEGVLRRPYLLVALVGVVALAITAVVAVWHDPRGGAAAATAGLVQVGVLTPVMAASVAIAGHPAVAAGAVLAGAGAGLLLARVAPLLCVVSAAVAVTAGSTIDRTGAAALFSERTALIDAVVLAVLAASAVAVVARVTPVAARRGRLPALLGPVAAAFVIAGGQVLAGIHGVTGSTGMPRGADRMPVSAALLLAAGTAAWVLGRDRRPAGTQTTDPLARAT